MVKQNFVQTYIFYYIFIIIHLLFFIGPDVWYIVVCMTTQFQIYLSNCIHIVKAIFYNNYIFYIAVIITVLKNSVSTFNINDLI